MTLDIVAANYEDRVVVLNDDSLLPIVTFFDSDGNETDDPNDATVFVCGEGNLWMVVDMSNLETVTLH